MTKTTLIVSIVSALTMATSGLVVAQTQQSSPTQASEATMLQAMPAGMRLSKDEVYAMYLAASQKGYIEKSSGDGSMIFIISGKGMNKSRQQVLKELMDQTPEQRRAANKP